MTVKSRTPGRAGIRPTDIPGVFRNKAGVLVNELGVALEFSQLKRLDSERFTEVLGKDITEPADLLKAVAMDPRLPLHLRIDTACKAAPYFTAKRLAIQGGGPGTPPISLETVEKMSQKQLDDLEKKLNQIASMIGHDK